MKAAVLSCFSWYGPACPKFSEATNHQYLWKGLSDFVDCLQVVICVLLDIHGSYKNMLLWAGIVRQSLSTNQIVRCFKLKKLKNNEVSSWFFASIEVRRNIKLFLVMTPKYSWSYITLAYLMPEAYSKPYQISCMLGHIENPCIVRTVYSGIFRYIQWHSAILSHFQAYWRTLVHVKAYFQALLRHTESYSDILNTVSPLLIQLYHIHNSV